MGESAKDGLSPAAQLHFWQLTAIEILKGHQDITGFLQRVTEDGAEGPRCIQTATELPPQGIRTREDFFEWDRVSADRGH